MTKQKETMEKDERTHAPDMAELLSSELGRVNNESKDMNSRLGSKSSLIAEYERFKTLSKEKERLGNAIKAADSLKNWIVDGTEISREKMYSLFKGITESDLDFKD